MLTTNFRLLHLILSISFLASTLLACAATPQGKAHQVAVIQKMGVDGVGNTYLDVCEQVVQPKCVEDNEASKSTDSPWTKEDRVACLKPCDSETASKIKIALDAVLAAQLAVFALLKSGSEDAQALSQARSELRESAEKLLQILEDTGARDFIEGKLFG